MFPGGYLLPDCSPVNIAIIKRWQHPDGGLVTAASHAACTELVNSEMQTPMLQAGVRRPPQGRQPAQLVKVEDAVHIAGGSRAVARSRPALARQPA